MGEKQNNILGFALILPPTPEGYTMAKSFVIPTEPNGHELFLNDLKKIMQPNKLLFLKISLYHILKKF